MKIFTAAQIRACDAYTVHASGISTLELTERAASACVAHITRHDAAGTSFVVLCGMGNNGADGLVIARLLRQAGHPVKVFLLQHKEEATADHKACVNKLLRMDASLLEYMAPDTFLADLPEQAVIIDAILGTGLSRPAEGWLAAFFSQVNHFPNRKIAIDLPSGMPADTVPPPTAPILKASETLSFQLYKRSFLHPETGPYCGTIHLLDIGLHETFIEGTHTHYQTIDADVVAGLRRQRSPFSYKNNYGHVQLIGGSYGKAGAAVLSAMAALRSGAGLVTALVPEQCAVVLQSAVPEAMCQSSGSKFLEALPVLEQASAVGIGPGMDTREVSLRAFADFVEQATLPCVFDADALNMLAMKPELMSKIPEQSILTPHPGECRRLFGDSINSMQQVEHIRMQAMRYKLCIVLKGRHTVIATPDGDCWYNMSGNAGMAKAGSGDVLTGLLAGLLAQGYDSVSAALLGVYLHGLAGDLAAQNVPQEAMTAITLVHHLAAAWQKLGKS